MGEDLNGSRLKWYNNLVDPLNRIIILWFNWWNRRNLTDLTWPYILYTLHLHFSYVQLSYFLSFLDA